MLKNLLNDLLRRYDWRPSSLADAMGVDRGTVTKWGLTRVPKRRLDVIKRLTGIQPSALRPDLFVSPKGESHGPAAPSTPSPAIPE